MVFIAFVTGDLGFMASQFCGQVTLGQAVMDTRRYHTFKTLFVFVVLSLDWRRIIHLDVTSNPITQWTSLQLNHGTENVCLEFWD